MNKGNEEIYNTYILADLQDAKNEYWNKTLEEAKKFLAELWADLEDGHPFLTRIEQAKFEDVQAMLEACDYTLFANIEEFQNYLKNE